MAADKNITEEEFEEITTFFYKIGSADKALLAMQYFIDSDLLSNAVVSGPLGPMPYFFYRAAQIYPELWPKYGVLFEGSSQKQRLFIIWLFALENDEETDKSLMAWREKKDYEELHSQIDELLEMEGRGENAIDLEQISTGGDLDRLWGEFLITGNQIAIQKIINVLEWPDLIRGRLEESLKQRSVVPLQEHDSISEFHMQLLNQGIVLDSECGSIYSAQDLDCFCVMEGCEISSDRLDTMKLIFPFELSDSDLSYMGMKASAKWSLCSNAMQHEVVLDTCKEEGSKRGGGCRLSLLEIITRSYLVTNDLEHGLNGFYESLTLDPVARDGQRNRAQETYSKLLLLDINGDKQAIDVPPNHELAIKECLNTCESLHSYRAKMIWREQGAISTQDDEMFWEVEYVKPDRFRVEQTAGNDFDEWITIADIHYRGPMFHIQKAQEMDDGELLLNHALIMSDYLNIMQEVQPDKIRTQNLDTDYYLTLDYINLDIGRLKLFTDREEGIGLPLMRLWTAKSTSYLAKAELILDLVNDNGSPVKLSVIHLFAGQNEDISIIPPPFEVIQYQPEGSKKKALDIPKMGLVKRSSYIILITVALAFLLIALPYQLFHGLFEWNYIVGILFWISVASYAYKKLIG